MAGADVTTLQNDLTVAGIPTLASGVFSEGTALHVETFQSRYHLKSDGVVGPATARKINKIVAVLNRQEAADTAVSGTASIGGGVALSGTATTPVTSTTSGPGSTAPTTPAPAPLPVADSGGAGFVPPPSSAPVERATLSSGLAVAPGDAPLVISEVIAAANTIAFDPYIYGGGHASFDSVGYDCSGSLSFALHGGGLVSSPIDSTQFESYGVPGAGRWITIWANGGHTYMKIAGLWYDTASQSAANGNDRWSPTRISPRAGFVEVHPAGW